MFTSVSEVKWTGNQVLFYCQYLTGHFREQKLKSLELGFGLVFDRHSLWVQQYRLTQIHPLFHPFFAVAMVAHEDSAASSSFKLCYIFVFLTVLFIFWLYC